MFDLVRFVFAITIFIPAVGEVGQIMADMIGFFAELWMLLWFISLQVPFTGKGMSKRALGFLGAAFSNLIPFLNFLPVTTLAVFYTVRDVRKTDKEALKKWQAEQKILAEQQARMQKAATEYVQTLAEQGT